MSIKKFFIGLGLFLMLLGHPYVMDMPMGLQTSL